MKKAAYLLLLLFVAVAACRKPKELVYQEIGNFGIKKAGLKQTIISLDIRLYNPNKYTLKLKTANVDVYMNDSHLGKMLVGETTSFAALDTTALPVMLDVDLMNVLPNAFQLLINSEVNIKLTGTLRAGRKGIYITVPINYEGKQDILAGIR
jgi:LEA14-like dessication related protein